MLRRFEKFQGLGNDFVIVEGAAPSTAEVVAACDRHLGIGADGVIAIEDASMRVVNADGTVPEMCGNGLRCVALYLYRKTGETSLAVNTDAGVHRCTVIPPPEGQRSGFAQVRAQMAIPAVGAGAVAGATDLPLIETPVPDVVPAIEVTAVSMGNPHAVLFDIDRDRAETLGPMLARHPWFTHGINVGFATVQNGGLTLVVYERGAGWTRACGTGACAAAVAAIFTGRLPEHRPVPVTLPGGCLTVEVGPIGTPVWMTGPAVRSYEGTVDFAQLAASSRARKAAPS